MGSPSFGTPQCALVAARIEGPEVPTPRALMVMRARRFAAGGTVRVRPMVVAPVMTFGPARPRWTGVTIVPGNVGPTSRKGGALRHSASRRPGKTVHDRRSSTERSRGTVLVAGALALLLTGCGASTPTQASAKQGISRVYDSLFNFTNKNLSVKLADIQNGSSLKTAISQALSSSLAHEATGARVDTVKLLSTSTCSQEMLSSPCAEVTYDLLGTTGQPLFTTPSSGYAVYVSGNWLVAKATICSLLELFYSASGRSGSPPGC